ncbi:hypothetical protein ACQ4PT_061811 [Festuca glaucescens]
MAITEAAMLHEVVRIRVLCVAAVALVLAGVSKATMAVMALEEAETMPRASRVARRAWGLVTMMKIGEQTVQAVIAAVTAATKAAEPSAVSVSHAAIVADDMGVATGQQVGMPVAAPNINSQLPTVISQGTQDTQGVRATGKENEGQGPLKKKKKEDKAGCFRCKKPGHYIDDCPTPFCDLCESIHHATPACHLLNAPKPTSIIHGYANEALMFFELPCGAFKAKAENAKLAKVTVDGDAMTIPEIIEQLKKIVPSEKFNWEVFHFRDNVYRVKLPNSDVFIIRGFFKLHFEVETTQGSQKVNMAEANNGNDGNDDAHNGEENNGGGNAMDMDPKGVDEGNTSNNNGQEGSYENNGVEGMQVQSNHIDAIQIGTMNVQITPTDIRPRVSTSGLPQVGGVVAAAVLPVADSLLRAGQSAQRPTNGVQPTQQLAAAALPLADSKQRAMQAGPLPPNGVQGSGQVVGCHMHAGD